MVSKDLCTVCFCSILSHKGGEDESAIGKEMGIEEWFLLVGLGHWWVDVAKRVGHVGVGSGQLGLQVNQVAGQVDSYFSNNFFIFIFIFWNRCNISIVYEFLNCDYILTGDTVANYH